MHDGQAEVGPHPPLASHGRWFWLGSPAGPLSLRWQAALPSQGDAPAATPLNAAAEGGGVRWEDGSAQGLAGVLGWCCAQR